MMVQPLASVLRACDDIGCNKGPPTPGPPPTATPRRWKRRRKRTGRRFGNKPLCQRWSIVKIRLFSQQVATAILSITAKQKKKEAEKKSKETKDKDEKMEVSANQFMLVVPFVHVDVSHSGR